MSAEVHRGDSPQEGARRLALDLLEEAIAARALLGSEDAEALHDFRVAVRRLRSAQRTFAEELGEAGGKRSRRRWRDLARLTGPGRDAEAQEEWLARAQVAMTPAAAAAARAMRQSLAARRERERGEIDDAGRRFDRLAARLRDDLAVYTIRLDEPAESSFGAVAEERVRALAGQLSERLREIAGAHDESGAHAARIAGKRLRYGLEVAAPGAKRSLARLKSLQDLLGELHDIHGLMRRVVRRARRQARDRAERLAALVIEQGTASDEFQRQSRRGGPPCWPLLDALRRRQAEVFAELQRDWPAGGEECLAPAVEALVEQALRSRREPPENGAATP